MEKEFVARRLLYLEPQVRGATTLLLRTSRLNPAEIGRYVLGFFAQEGVADQFLKLALALGITRPGFARKLIVSVREPPY